MLNRSQTHNKRTLLGAWLLVLAGILVRDQAAAQAHKAACTRLDLPGEVAANHEWRAQIGQGWVFRLVPIVPGQSGYSGWDLVVDRDPGTGYPDALMLATPPFNSINEREIGTTYGLRAQDAIGWNPRSFRFITDPAAFAESQKLFLTVMQPQALKSAAASVSGDPAYAKAWNQLMALQQRSAAGQFHIDDARITPGDSDAAEFATSWAIRSVRTQHTNVPAPDGKSTPLGAIAWMRFTVTLRLPAGWKTPPGAKTTPAPCE